MSRWLGNYDPALSGRVAAACGHPSPCGCDGVAPCCDGCPLPRCRFEEPGIVQRLRREQRDSAILEAAAQGRNVGEIVQAVGAPARTVQRVLGRGRATAG